MIHKLTFTGSIEPKGTVNKRNKSFNRLLWKIKNFFQYRLREWLSPGHVTGVGRVYGKVIRQDGSVTDLGLIGEHLVVTAGKNLMAGFLNGVGTVTNLKFHGFGTGSTPAVVGDTALQTELSTAYATDNVRPTGSQANSTNTYTTVATLTPDAAVAITEWGLLTQAATGGGTLFDHQVFSAVNLNGTGDSLQITYVLTFS